MKIYKSSILLLCVLLTACHSREVGFTYSPLSPRAGQTITFTNTSEVGESWSWNFGDGSSSASKSPSKVFKTAGEYVVSLKVDNKKSLTYSATIVVLDTMPIINVSDTMPDIYSEVQLSVSIYNPNNLSINYQWLLSDNAVISDAAKTDSAVTVYFREPNESEEITLAVTMGAKTDTVSRIIKVEDILSPSVIVNHTDNSLKRYRLFDFELGRATSIAQDLAARHIEVSDDKVYAFTDDGVFVIDANGSKEQIVESDKPVIAGTIMHDSVFWKSANEAPHGSPLGRKVVSSDDNILDDWHSADTMVVSAVYMTSDGNNLCFSGKGCVIGVNGWFSEYSYLKSVAIDRVNGKIYMIDGDNGLLLVANLNGNIGDVATIGKSDSNTLSIHNESDRLFYVNNGQLMSLPLIHTQRNINSNTPTTLSSGVSTFCIDQVQSLR